MTQEPPLRLPARKNDAHKGNFGRVLLVGGSRGMSGSVALSAMAALRCGSGLVTAAVPDRCLETVAAFHPCIMTLPMPDDGNGRFSLGAAGSIADRFDGVSAVGCGPGMTTEPGSLRIVERLLHTATMPRVLDADALNAFAILQQDQEHEGTFEELGALVLTPHPGEIQRLTGVSANDRDAQIDAAKTLAQRTGAVIVLKGGPTIVVDAQRSWTNTTGNPGMASAGTGDVLTGVITSLLGQQLSNWDAACLGVWVHGLAGDIAADRHGRPGMTALEILDAMPEAMMSAAEQ